MSQKLSFRVSYLLRMKSEFLYEIIIPTLSLVQKQPQRRKHRSRSKPIILRAPKTGIMSDNDHVLQELLETIAAEHGYKNCDMKLQSYSTEGANYTSQLYNVSLTAPGKDDLKLFAKVASVNEEVRLQSPFNMFETEMFFYTSLLKQYQELEEKHKVPEEHRLATVKFYGCKKEFLKEILVFEDVTSKGFGTFQRHQLIDWEYASTAIRELAKFHALSIALHQQKPLEFEDITKKFTLDRKKLEGMKPMMDAATKMLLEIVKEENKDRIRAFMKKAQDFPVDHFNRPMHQPVISHGDFRTSNFMHRVQGVSNIFII